MKYAILLTLLASPTLAQEFTFDDTFDFDDELVFEEVAPLTVIPSVKISATAGLSYSDLGGVTNTTYAAQINVANEHNLGALGYLEWAGNVLISEGDVTANLSRIHLQNSGGDFSWKIGKYRIGWGEIEGVPVLDVVNSGLSFSGASLPSDELSGQWFAGLDYFGNGFSLSGFAGLAPEVSHTLPSSDNTDFEFGLQARIPISDGQINLYAAQLLPQSGVVDMSALGSVATPFTLVGISANKAVGNVLLEFDLAGKFGLERSTLAGLETHDRIDAAVGIEYAAGNTLQISAAIFGQHWLEQTQDYYVPGPTGVIATGQTSASYMLGISDIWFNGKLGVSANLGGTLDGSTGIVALSASYTYSDALKFTASAMSLSAAPSTQLAPMDGFTQFGLSASYYF